MQGTLFSKFVFETTKQKTVSSYVILILSLMLLMHLTNIYIYQFSSLRIPFHILPVAIVSYGPLVHAYVKSLAMRGTTLPRHVLYSFIPVLVISAIHIYGYENHLSWQHVLFHIFIYVYSLVYLALSVVFVYKNLAQKKHEWSWTYHLLLLITSFILFIALDYASFITSYQYLKVFANTGIVLIGFVITAVFLMQNLLYPSIAGVPHRTCTNGRDGGNKLYAVSQEGILASQLTSYMKTQQPHLQSDLTVRKLSEALDIPAHVLSSLINHHFQKNFLDFINSYRIEKAKKILAQHDVKILAVALESGFSNKTSFNRTFKKLTGMAPSDFRKNNK